ncbi:MAG: branched-chain amino acid transport system II carrier protein [Verrucomicrobiota bacterium]|nr:branched-chain amino acid transport system II carrier protein [Verrucomicrobiota bacterium]
MEQQSKSSSLATGLALFSMFFGAGNLIFPLLVGKTAGTETGSALAGLGISAVLFPFLGLIAMMLYGGDLKLFVSRLGKWPGAILLFVLFMSQGPIGAIPRLLTLMHASVKPYFPTLSLGWFSVALCGLVFVLTIRPHKMVQLLGTVLTPLLLLTLGGLVLFGVPNAPEALAVSEGTSFYFKEGLKGGYQTLDLTAALLFATVIIPHLARGSDPVLQQRQIRRQMLAASSIAAALLLSAYIGLCWLSAHHAGSLPANIAPEEILHVIAVKILGPFGGFIATGAVFLACLTTAISLAAVSSRYFETEWFRGKSSFAFSLALTLGVSAAMATLGFSGIMKMWGPILEILYPGLIVLCLFNIGYSLYRVRSIKTPVFLTLAIGIAGVLFRGIGA